MAGQPIIIGCMAVAVLDTTIVDLRKSTNKSPAFRIILGGFVVTVALLVVSDSQPEIAETVALLILLATLFGPNGTALADLLAKLTGTDYKLPTKPVVQLPTYVDPNAKYNKV